MKTRPPFRWWFTLLLFMVELLLDKLNSHNKSYLYYSKQNAVGFPFLYFFLDHLGNNISQCYLHTYFSCQCMHYTGKLNIILEFGLEPNIQLEICWYKSELFKTKLYYEPGCESEYCLLFLRKFNGSLRSE